MIVVVIRRVREGSKEERIEEDLSGYSVEGYKFFEARLFNFNTLTATLFSFLLIIF